MEYILKEEIYMIAVLILKM